MTYYNHLSLVGQLIAAASRVTRYSVEDLTSVDRTQNLCQIRYAVMLIARRKGIPLTRIAHGLNREDHTTVLNGLRRGSKLLNDPTFTALVGRITAESEIDEQRAAA